MLHLHASFKTQLAALTLSFTILTKKHQLLTLPLLYANFSMLKKAKALLMLTLVLLLNRACLQEIFKNLISTKIKRHYVCI